MRWLLFSWSLVAAAPVSAGGPADSAVRVHATIQNPDLLRPWIKQKPIEVAGSGAVIEDRQILTNAHIVLYAGKIEVQGQDGKKFAAKVKAIAPGINLAVLTVADKDFFAARPALPRSKKLPRAKALVKVYGYPTGRDKLAIVPSKVFRIEFISYSVQTSGVQAHIESILNPGMSGGPVMQGKNMIGLALSLGRRDQFGRVIPNEEIDAFLEDVADGRYDGKPWLHASLQNLENDALRKKLRLRSSAQGLLVTRAGGPLQRFDVLTKIGGYFLDNDGLVQADEDLRFPFQYLVPRVVRDGKVRAGILRGGESLNVELPVTRASEFLIRELNGKYPRYYLYGPLVFSPATIESADQLMQLNPDPSNPLVQRQSDRARFLGEELVVVTSVLPHQCLAGYPNPLGRVVREVNGVEIKSFGHLVDVLRDNTGEFVTLELAAGQPELIVLQRADMSRVTQEIMKKNDIPSRGSRN
jgi:S1-C subfamily serine protease